MGRAAAATDVASARCRSVASWLSSVRCNRWIFTSSPLHHPPPPAPHPQLLHTCLSAAQPGAVGKAPRSHFQPLRGERHRRREMIESPSPLHFFFFLFFLHLFPLQWINLCLQCRIGVYACPLVMWCQCCVAYARTGRLYISLGFTCSRKCVMLFYWFI